MNKTRIKKTKPQEFTFEDETRDCTDIDGTQEPYDWTEQGRENHALKPCKTCRDETIQ